MPLKSAAQFRLMQAALHGTLKGPGPSAAVAKEFIRKTSAKKRSQYAKGRNK
jgi:hypothetical protein